MLNLSKSSIARRVLVTAVVSMVAIGCGSNSFRSNPEETKLEAQEEAAHWSYEGSTGPSYWGSLDPKFAACADGSAQTPIDIKDPVATDLADLEFAYAKSEAEIFNNGHTIQANASQGSTMTIDGQSYELLQIHFHAPSEHTIGGRSFPAEVHFVHATSDGDLAVVGVMLAGGGAKNTAWSTFVNGLSTKEGSKHHATIDWLSMYPNNHQTIRYAGSLTTPPCTEGVRWFLMTSPVEISDAQLNAFRAAYEGNNRPIEPLDGRTLRIDSTND
jgi:carbonic anhydrase